MLLFRRSLVLVALVLLAGCSTFKGWFTPEGHRLAEAQTLADQGHPLGASALAVEALVLDPDYPEARQLLDRVFAAGQDEFLSATGRWAASEDPQRWDRLVELYRWQDTLARRGPQVGPGYRVDPVSTVLADASREAGLYHLSRAEGLLAEVPGPRQARRALEEGKVAQGYDSQTPGLAAWMTTAREAARQKLLVIPFFFEGAGAPGAVSGPLASRISRNLVEGLPELTSIFPSDRLVTLPGAGLARLGVVTEPDALALAAAAGQNLVLLGQVTTASYRQPSAAPVSVVRERTVLEVDPGHPAGTERTYRAILTKTDWSVSVTLAASFSVIEVATGQDLGTAVREVTTGASGTQAFFTGDRAALTPGDLDLLAASQPPAEGGGLWARGLDALAAQVADAVRQTLR